VRAAVGADADQVKGLGAFPGLRCRIVLEEHEGRPVPVGRGAGCSHYRQVAGLSTCGQPQAQVSYTLPSHDAQPVVPERIVGDELAER
jgi:hypothetical protein